MTMQHQPIGATVPAPQSVFERILVGVDGTKESLDACRQAARLANPDATVEAATVSAFPPAAARALGVDDLAERLDQTASSTLSAAARILGPHAELRRLDGMTVNVLLAEVERSRATLLAMGTHGHARLQEIVLGGTAGELLHRAPCAVLVARTVPDSRAFPRDIVVGIDGSEQSEHAYEVARSLAGRRHSRLRSVVALAGKHVELEEIAGRHCRVEAVDAAPVRALVEASETADLLVVGSRGLHGPRALGSVSERTAHAASCSVLVVR
jgi:nucleotide-binding universal stress UspA family protein